MNDYHFFWSGPFSQWWRCDFWLEGIRFNCAEQYMMWAKAHVFGDKESEERILKTYSPKEQKAIGRTVKGYNEEKWIMMREVLVTIGNIAKFEQNWDLQEQLLKTKGKTLVEASPYDKIWGIGLNEEKAKEVNPSEWPGLNLLGKVLTRIRDNHNWEDVFNISCKNCEIIIPRRLECSVVCPACLHTNSIIKTY